uniref:Ovule protein n=1 Tax=Heterorhabditis bacteriophora TaxID=37862 RepID=A0A1I7WNY9_HETBA
MAVDYSERQICRNCLKDDEVYLLQPTFEELDFDRSMISLNHHTVDQMYFCIHSILNMADMVSAERMIVMFICFLPLH